MSPASSVRAVLVVILSLHIVSCGEPPEFLISYWGGPPAAESSLERYREIAECGFNVAMPPADATDIKTNLKILDACKEVGLKAIVRDPRLQLSAAPSRLEKTVDAIVADYSAHPALAGYFITDEPNARLFGALATVTQRLLKRDPERVPFVNLFPNYATSEQLGSSSYEEHVSQYIATVRPALVSWDHYKQMAGDESLYFKNLDIVRRQCRSAKTPFIQIILSLPHWGYRDPGEADLRWQVYTSLAYGARGIMYFTYWTLPAWNLGDGPAIIGPDGKRDVKYEFVRRLNGRLKALGVTLMQLESTGVYASAPLPPGVEKLPGDGPVRRAEGGSLLIGCFTGPKEAPYVLVVNRSFEDGCVARITAHRNTVSVTEISQESGEPAPAVSLVDGAFAVPLEAGEGKLFVVNQQ